MSYCLNCGVELSSTETVCPLCQTKIGSEENASAVSQGAYPSKLEAVPMNNIRTAVIGLILLLIPAVCCFAIDYIINGLISWSPYVLGGEICFYVYALLPAAFKRPKTSICVLIDSAVSFGYLYVVGLLNGSCEWVLPLGLPVALLTGLLIFCVIATIQHKKITMLMKAAVVIGMIGLFSVALEIDISLFRLGIITLGWALPVLLPSAIISAGLFIIESNRTFKEKLLKKIWLFV